MATNASTISVGVSLDSASLNKALSQVSSAIDSVRKQKVNLSLDSGGFTQPLGRIRASANEFSKSLEASNARVIAFGASAGLIFQVQRAFSELLQSTIAVEKSLMDINVILGESSAGLEQFAKGLFDVARLTGQSFSTVAKAATELARQGLSAEETLKRTTSALILTRLSGLDAASSVEALTAALNTFNGTGLTSEQIVNKLASVDASFAVSTGDLAEALKRVGATAQDVGVSFDQLLGIVAATQQMTARGGAVIGNSLKSIFTRLQRTEVLDQIEGLGIAVRDMSGETLPAMTVLQNLAGVFNTLGKAQQSNVAETVAGVYQMNQLRAILSDLSKGQSIYGQAVSVSSKATNEATSRSEKLNQTLDAQLKITVANATQAAKKIGDLTFAPAINTVLGGINKVLGDFNNKDSESVGGKIAEGIMSGIGSFLAGPGLALGLGLLLKLMSNLGKFVGESGAQFLGLNTRALQQKTLQQDIQSILQRNPELITKASSSTQGHILLQEKLLALLRDESMIRSKIPAISSQMAERMIRGGTTVSSTGRVSHSGFVPNFSRAAEHSEIAGAIAGGYEPGRVVPSPVGGVMNTAETVKHVPGFTQPFINPPRESKAGRAHEARAIRDTGVNPYTAANGFVPNFASTKHDPKGHKDVLPDYQLWLEKKDGTHTRFADGKQQELYNMVSPEKAKGLKSQGYTGWEVKDKYASPIQKGKFNKGFIPNFGLPNLKPGARESLERLAKEPTPEGKTAASVLQKYKNKGAEDVTKLGSLLSRNKQTLAETMGFGMGLDLNLDALAKPDLSYQGLKALIQKDSNLAKGISGILAAANPGDRKAYAHAREFLHPLGLAHYDESKRRKKDGPLQLPAPQSSAGFVPNFAQGKATDWIAINKELTKMIAEDNGRFTKYVSIKSIAEKLDGGKGLSQNNLMLGRRTDWPKGFSQDNKNYLNEKAKESNNFSAATLGKTFEVQLSNITGSALRVGAPLDFDRFNNKEKRGYRKIGLDTNKSVAEAFWGTGHGDSYMLEKVIRHQTEKNFNGNYAAFFKNKMSKGDINLGETGIVEVLGNDRQEPFQGKTQAVKATIPATSLNKSNTLKAFINNSKNQKLKQKNIIFSYEKDGVLVPEIPDQAFGKSEGFIPNLALDGQWTLEGQEAQLEKEAGTILKSSQEDDKRLNELRPLTRAEEKRKALLTSAGRLQDFKKDPPTTTRPSGDKKNPYAPKNMTPAMAKGAAYENFVKNKLPSFGFSNAVHLSGQSKNIPADFYAVNTGSPWLVDAKDDASPHPSRKEGTMRSFWDRTKINEAGLKNFSERLAGQEPAEAAKIKDDKSYQSKMKFGLISTGGSKAPKSKAAFSGFIPNFAPLDDAMGRERSAAGSAVPLFSKMLNSPVVVNNEQIAKYGSNADRIIEADHIGMGQVGTKPNLMATGSGAEKYKARGFVPNFAALRTQALSPSYPNLTPDQVDDLDILKSRPDLIKTAVPLGKGVEGAVYRITLPSGKFKTVKVPHSRSPEQVLEKNKKLRNFYRSGEQVGVEILNKEQAISLTYGDYKERLKQAGSKEEVFRTAAATPSNAAQEMAVFRAFQDIKEAKGEPHLGTFAAFGSETRDRTPDFREAAKAAMRAFREKAQGAGSSFSRGFVPSLAEAEVRGALTGGYKPGNVVPSPVGGVMNTAETVKYVPGFSQPFINPPERSKAGKEHKIKSMEQAGVNPYAFSGFVPNFAQPTEFLEEDPFNLKKYNGSIKGTAKAYPKTKTQLEAIKKLRDRIEKSSEPLNGDKQATRKQQKWEAVAEAVKSYKALGIQTTGELELRLGFSQNSFSTYSSNKKGKDGELSANAAGVEKAIGPESFKALSKKAEKLAQSGSQKSPKAARLGREFESKLAAAFDLPAESANSRPMDFSGVRALKQQEIKYKISMDPKTFVGDAHNTYGHGDDFFFNKYVRQKGEDGSPIALGLNNRLEEEQQRRQKISSKGGAPKKNPVTVPNVGRYTEILNGGSKKDSNYQAFTFKVKDVREHAQKSISKYLDKKYNDEIIQFSYAKDGIDLSKLDKSATGLIPNFAGYSSASVGISKAFQEQRLKSGEQTDAFQNKYHLAVGSNTVHPAFKKAFEKNGIPFSQSKRGFDLTDLKGSYAKLSQAAADAKTFAPTDPEERRSIAGEKNTSDESFAKVWSDYIDSYLNTKKITEISSLVTSQGPKSDFSSVRSAGFIPNFAPLDDAMGRERSAAGSAVPLFSKMLNSPVVVNNEQIAKYGSNADRIIQGDHIENGQVATRSNLMKSGSGKEKYSSKGFVPNFGEAPGMIGEGERVKAYKRIGPDGKPYVVKAPKAVGVGPDGHRKDAIAHAIDQQTLSQRYKKALAPFPWFNALEQKNVGGGILKQPLAKGKRLSEVLEKAYPSDRGAGREVAERSKSGALGSFQKFFGKLGLPYDSMGMAGNILVPEEHQAKVVEIFQKQARYLYAKMFGNQGGGFPNGAFNIIDYAKGFVPKLIDQKGGPDAGKREIFSGMGKDDLASLMEAHYRPSGSYEEPRNLNSNNLLFKILRGNRGTPWIDQTLADYDLFERSEVNEKGKYPDEEARALSRAKWARDYFPKKEKIIKSVFFPSSGAPGSRPTRSEGFIPNFAGRKTPPAKGIGPLHRDFLAQVPQDLPKLLKDSPEAVKTINRLYEEHKGLKYVANGGESFVFRTEGEDVLKVPYVFPREDPKSRKNGEEEHQDVLNRLFAGKKVDTKQNNIQEKMRRVGRFDWEGAKKDLAGTNLVLPKSSVSADGSHYSQPFAGSVLSNVITRKSVGPGDLDPYAINRSIMGSIDATFKKRQKSKTDHPINRMFLDTGSVENFTFIDPKKNFDANNILLDDRKTAKKIFAKNDFGLIDVGITKLATPGSRPTRSEGFIPNFASKIKVSKFESRFLGRILGDPKESFLPNQFNPENGFDYRWLGLSQSNTKKFNELHKSLNGGQKKDLSRHMQAGDLNPNTGKRRPEGSADAKGLFEKNFELIQRPNGFPSFSKGFIPNFASGLVPNFKKQTGLKKEELSFKAGKRRLVNLNEIDAEDGAEHGSIETFDENGKKVGYLKYIEDSVSFFIAMNKNLRKGNSKFSGIGLGQFKKLKELAQKKGKVIKSSEITPQKDKLKLVGNPDSTNWAKLLAVHPPLKHRITEGLTTSGSLSIMGRGISKSFSNIGELRGFTNSVPRQDFLSDLKRGRILINELESAPTNGIGDAKVPFAAEGFIPNFAHHPRHGLGPNLQPDELKDLAIFKDRPGILETAEYLGSGTEGIVYEYTLPSGKKKTIKVSKSAKRTPEDVINKNKKLRGVYRDKTIFGAYGDPETSFSVQYADFKHRKKTKGISTREALLQVLEDPNSATQKTLIFKAQFRAFKKIKEDKGEGKQGRTGVMADEERAGTEDFKKAQQSGTKSYFERVKALKAAPESEFQAEYDDGNYIVGPKGSVSKKGIRNLNIATAIDPNGTAVTFKDKVEYGKDSRQASLNERAFVGQILNKHGLTLDEHGENNINVSKAGIGAPDPAYSRGFVPNFGKKNQKGGALDSQLTEMFAKGQGRFDRLATFLTQEGDKPEDHPLGFQTGIAKQRYGKGMTPNDFTDFHNYLASRPMSGLRTDITGGYFAGAAPANLSEFSQELKDRFKRIREAGNYPEEYPIFKGAAGGFVPNFGAAKRERNETKRFDLNRMTKGGDGALNDAYNNYGLSTEGANFGWKANQASAKYAMRLIGSGETDIEKISDAVHKGWSSTAFSDSAGKLKLDKATPESKKAKRLVLANQSYSELSEEEKEKDRVLARAYLKDYQENQGKQKNASGGFVPNFANHILKTSSGDVTKYTNPLGDSSLNTADRVGQGGEEYTAITGVERNGFGQRRGGSGVDELYKSLFREKKGSNRKVYSASFTNQALAKGKAGKTISDDELNFPKLIWAFPQIRPRIDAEKKSKMPTSGTLTARSAPGVDNPVKFFEFKTIEGLTDPTAGLKPHVNSLRKIPSSVLPDLILQDLVTSPTFSGGFIPNFASVFNERKHKEAGGTVSQANGATSQGLLDYLAHIGMPYSGKPTKAGLTEFLAPKERKLQLYKALRKDPISIKKYPELHNEIADGNHRYELAVLAGIKNVPSNGASGFVPNFAERNAPKSKAAFSGFIPNLNFNPIGRGIDRGLRQSTFLVGQAEEAKNNRYFQAIGSKQVIPELVAKLNKAGITNFQATRYGIQFNDLRGAVPKLEQMLNAPVDPNTPDNSRDYFGKDQVLRMKALSQTPPKPNYSSAGFVPNFSSRLEQSEIAGAIAGGYEPGKVVKSPVGGVMNTAEDVVYAAEFSQPFINPPERSKAGREHKQASVSSVGLNPYELNSAKGFVPNFGNIKGWHATSEKLFPGGNISASKSFGQGQGKGFYAWTSRASAERYGKNFGLDKIISGNFDDKYVFPDYELLAAEGLQFIKNNKPLLENIEPSRLIDAEGQSIGMGVSTDKKIHDPAMRAALGGISSTLFTDKTYGAWEEPTAEMLEKDPKAVGKFKSSFLHKSSSGISYDMEKGSATIATAATLGPLFDSLRKKHSEIVRPFELGLIKGNPNAAFRYTGPDVPLLASMKSEAAQDADFSHMAMVRATFRMRSKQDMEDRAREEERGEKAYDFYRKKSQAKAIKANRGFIPNFSPQDATIGEAQTGSEGLPRPTSNRSKLPNVVKFAPSTTPSTPFAPMTVREQIEEEVRLLRRLREQRERFGMDGSTPPNKARGFVPNFSPQDATIGEAQSREQRQVSQSMGIPKSQVSTGVGYSSKLVTPDNPSGAGVFSPTMQMGNRFYDFDKTLANFIGTTVKDGYPKDASSAENSPFSSQSIKHAKPTKLAIDLQKELKSGWSLAAQQKTPAPQFTVNTARGALKKFNDPEVATEIKKVLYGSKFNFPEGSVKEVIALGGGRVKDDARGWSQDDSVEWDKDYQTAKELGMEIDSVKRGDNKNKLKLSVEQRKVIKMFQRGGGTLLDDNEGLLTAIPAAVLLKTKALGKEVKIKIVPYKEPRLRKSAAAKGFVPNFSSRIEQSEIAGAITGGYEPGKVVPSPVGGVMNTAETVKYVPGFSQPFINPPRDSEVGRAHEARAIRDTGVNPYTAAKGFVPNLKIDLTRTPEQAQLKTDKTVYNETVKKTRKIGPRLPGILGAVLESFTTDAVLGAPGQGIVGETKEVIIDLLGKKYQNLIPTNIQKFADDARKSGIRVTDGLLKELGKIIGRVKVVTRKIQTGRSPFSADGFVPNLAQGPISDAIEREKAAGYSSSEVKVGFDSRLKSSGGIGVYNSTEGSLGNAINMHLASGKSIGDLKTQGAKAKGFVPNLAGVDSVDFSIIAGSITTLAFYLKDFATSVKRIAQQDLKAAEQAKKTAAETVADQKRVAKNATDAQKAEEDKLGAAPTRKADPTKGSKDYKRQQIKKNQKEFEEATTTYESKLATFRETAPSKQRIETARVANEEAAQAQATGAQATSQAALAQGRLDAENNKKLFGAKGSRMDGKFGDFIKNKGMGAGLGVQVLAGAAEQFVGNTETPEGRRSKATVGMLGQAAGMAGTGAMIGGAPGAAVGLAVGLAIGAAGAYKAGIKTSEDYARALELATKAQTKAVESLNGYSQAQTNLNDLLSRGIGGAVLDNAIKDLIQKLKSVDDPALMEELVKAGSNTVKIGEVTAKVTKKLAESKEKGSIPGLLTEVYENMPKWIKGEELKDSQKDRLKNIGTAISSTGDMNLGSYTPETLTKRLQQGGVKNLAKIIGSSEETAQRIQGLNEKEQLFLLKDIQSKEKLEKTAKQAQKGLQELGVAAFKVAVAVRGMSRTSADLVAKSQITFDSSRKVTEAVESSKLNSPDLNALDKMDITSQNQISKLKEEADFEKYKLTKTFQSDSLSEYGGKDLNSPGPTGAEKIAFDAFRGFSKGNPMDEKAQNELVKSLDGNTVAQEELRAKFDNYNASIQQSDLRLKENIRVQQLQNDLLKLDFKSQERTKLVETGGLGTTDFSKAIEGIFSKDKFGNLASKMETAKNKVSGYETLSRQGFNVEEPLREAKRGAFRQEAEASLNMLMGENGANALLDADSRDNKRAVLKERGAADPELVNQIINALSAKEMTKKEDAAKEGVLAQETKIRDLATSALGLNTESILTLASSNLDLGAINKTLGTQMASLEAAILLKENAKKRVESESALRGLGVQADKFEVLGTPMWKREESLLDWNYDGTKKEAPGVAEKRNENNKKVPGNLQLLAEGATKVLEDAGENFNQALVNAAKELIPKFKSASNGAGDKYENQVNKMQQKSDERALLALQQAAASGSPLEQPVVSPGGQAGITDVTTIRNLQGENQSLQQKQVAATAARTAAQSGLTAAVDSAIQGAPAGTNVIPPSYMPDFNRQRGDQSNAFSKTVEKEKLTSTLIGAQVTSADKAYENNITSINDLTRIMVDTGITGEERSKAEEKLKDLIDAAPQLLVNKSLQDLDNALNLSKGQLQTLSTNGVAINAAVKKAENAFVQAQIGAIESAAALHALSAPGYALKVATERAKTALSAVEISAVESAAMFKAFTQDGRALRTAIAEATTAFNMAGINLAKSTAELDSGVLDVAKQTQARDENTAINTAKKDFATGRTDATGIQNAEGNQNLGRLRRGEIGVMEAFGADSMSKMRAESANTREQLLKDMISIKEGMVDSFKTGFEAFAFEGKKAGDVGKELLKTLMKGLMDMSFNFGINKFYKQMSTGTIGMYNTGGKVKGGIERYATGGKVSGGSGLRDDVPAVLTAGEYVIRKGAVNKYGEDFFSMLNRGGVVKFAEGGMALGAGPEDRKLTEEIAQELNVSGGSIQKALAETQDTSMLAATKRLVTGVGESKVASTQDEYNYNEDTGFLEKSPALAELGPGLIRSDTKIYDLNDPKVRGASGGKKTMALGMDFVTQDKQFFGAGSMPSQTAQSTSTMNDNALAFSLRNTFAWNDPERPTLGKFMVDEGLSNTALEDEENPQNAFKEKRYTLLQDYRSYIVDELDRRSLAVEQFKAQKKQLLKSALINAAVTVGSAVLGELGSETVDGVKTYNEFGKFMQSPGGQAVVGALSQAAISAGQGAKGNEILLAASMAGATAGVGTYGRQKGEQSRLNAMVNSGIPSLMEQAARELGERGIDDHNIKDRITYAKAQQADDEYKKARSGKFNSDAIQRAGDARAQMYQDNKNLYNQNGSLKVPSYGKYNVTRGALFGNFFGQNAPRSFGNSYQFKGSTSRGPKEKRAFGGKMQGQQGVDKIPAMLTAGEYVIKKDSVDKYGSNFFDQLNRGTMNTNDMDFPKRDGGPKVMGFAKGGPVPNVMGFVDGGQVATNGNLFGGGGYRGDNTGAQQITAPTSSDEMAQHLTKLIDVAKDIQRAIEEKEESGGETSSDKGGGESGAGQLITNNVNVTVNIAKGQEPTVETSSSKEGGKKKEGEDDPEKNERFANLMQGVVIKTIVEQQRPGGLLYEPN